MNRWILGIVSVAVIVPIVAFSADNALNVWGTPERVNQLELQFTESYMQQTTYIAELQEFNHQQRTANELNSQKWHQQEVDNNRRWEVIVGLMSHD